jgi:hypothetical protein
MFHRKRESIEAHLSVVFAALAVSHWIEHQTGWNIKRFIHTARRYRTVQIRAGHHTLTAADPLPDDGNRQLIAPSKHHNVAETVALQKHTQSGRSESPIVIRNVVPACRERTRAYPSGRYVGK